MHTDLETTDMSDSEFENDIMAYIERVGYEAALHKLIDVLNDNLTYDTKEFVVSDLWGE